MLVKLGVYGLDNLHPAMRLVKRHVEEVWEPEEPVISSCGEGDHCAWSFHYPAPLIQALDFRTPKNVLNKIEELKELLGEDYDVIFEGDHVHVEFDPKD